MAFTHTQISQDAYYGVDDLNDFFDKLASEINKKVDRDEPRPIINSLNEQVVVSSNLVVIGDNVYKLKGSFGLNNQPVINLGEAVESTDAITLGQVKELLKNG